MANLVTVTNFSFYCVFALSFLVQIQAKIIDNNNTLTFKWYDNVTAEKVEADYYNSTKHLAQFTKIYREINGTFFLKGTNFTTQYPNSISWRKSSGFVDTVFYSYQKHHNLIIRPDDIWTSIIVQFSLYINANAEALRHSFVNFEGKKKLEVKFYAPIDHIPINEFINEIVSLINGNIDPAIASWIKPNFTTTTENDELTAGAALMATVQKYFEYNLSLILCGIPEVTILGTVDDWKDIRQRVEKFEEFELNGQHVMATWSTMLRRILDEFVKVKEEGSKRDDNFWKQAIRVDYETVDLICSRMNETYLNGWITTFTAFDKSGKWQGDREIISSIEEETQWLRIRTDKITPGVVHIPINIYDEFAKQKEREYSGAIITGHMGYSVKSDEVTLQPLSGWAMTITNNPPEYLENKRDQTSQVKNKINLSKFYYK